MFKMLDTIKLVVCLRVSIDIIFYPIIFLFMQEDLVEQSHLCKIQMSKCVAELRESYEYYFKYATASGDRKPQDSIDSTNLIHCDKTAVTMTLQISPMTKMNDMKTESPQQCMQDDE